MSIDAEGRGVWLKITGEDDKGVLTTTHILLTSKEDVTAGDVLVDKKVTKDSPLVRRLREGYKEATTSTPFSFAHIDGGLGLDISGVIGRDGMAQVSFPLPNGKTFEEQVAIGLPRPCSNPRLLSISIDAEGRGVWLEITGEADKGALTTTHILLTSKENGTGRYA